jgi:hypothetical protein
LEGDREAEDFEGDLVGDLGGGVGCGSKPASSSSSSAEFGFLDDILEKNFICGVRIQNIH